MPKTTDPNALLALLKALREQEQPVGPQQETPPAPQPAGPDPRVAISPERSSQLQARNAAEMEIKNRSEKLLLQALRARQGYGYRDQPGSEFEGARHDIDRAEMAKLYGLKPGGFAKHIRGFIGSDPQSVQAKELLGRYEGDIRHIEDLESKLLSGPESAANRQPELSLDKSAQYSKELESVRQGLAFPASGEQTQRLKKDEARLSGSLGSQAFERQALPPEALEEDRFLKPQRNQPLESVMEQEAVQKAQARDDEQRYGVQKASRDSDLGLMMSDLLEKQGADQYAGQEAARMEAAIPKPETPTDRYLRMLSESNEPGPPGLLDIVATLGTSLGGGSPEQVGGLIDSLRGGPQRREKFGMARQAHEIYAGRESQDKQLQAGLQRESIEQGGALARQQAEQAGRRSNLEYEHGEIGKRQQSQQGSDLMQTILKLKAEGTKGPDMNVIARLMEQNQDPVETLIGNAKAKLNALVNNDLLFQADPKRYNAEMAEIMKAFARAEDLRQMSRAQFSAAAQSGDPFKMLQPSDTREEYKSYIDGIMKNPRMK